MAGRLYPPIVDYSMPAFALDGNDSTVRIYFSLPVYNSWSEVGSVHVTVRYLDSNENALSIGYPAKIKVAVAQVDEQRATRQDKYYIELNSGDLAKGFITGTIYKIQLRFSTLKLDKSGAGPAASWFNENYQSFSEWSTVVLIRPIAKPTFNILGLEGASEEASINYSSLDAIFTITYSQGDESEPLKSWRTRLYNYNKTELYADSGLITYNNYNYLPVDDTNSVAFDSLLPYTMQADNKYILQLDLITRNGYETGGDYYFTCFPIPGEGFAGNITAKLIESEAYAKIKVSLDQQFSSNLVIRRTSSISNFNIWEDVSVKTFTNETVDWEFKDFTIESGVWYKYGVQSRDIYGHRGSLVTIEEPIMCEFEDAFLFEECGRQLKLKYDFNISTANISIGEAKTDAIGSKYPYIRRNGNMYYRTFQCTGLITGYMDNEANLFTTDSELYNGEESRYQDLRNTIDLYVNSYDYTYERKFREKVQEFLYNNKIKLFKSLQEGNILVKLMNINLTPKNELGRLLYSFSCQMVEIDEANLNNLNNYGLQVIGEYANAITFSNETIGQLNSYLNYDETIIYPANTNIIQKIAEKYGWLYDNTGANAGRNSLNGIIIDDFQLTHLRIEFESEPYLIERNGDRLSVFNENLSSTKGKDLILGWLLNFDGDTILIQPPNNIYELKEDDLVINSSSSIYPLADTQMTVYFSIYLNEQIDSGLIPISTTYYKYLGQIYKSFKPNTNSDNIISILTHRFARNEKSELYDLSGLFIADIEADPGTIVYAKSSIVENETKFIINETGILHLDPGVEEVTIDTLHFEGKQIDIRYLDPLYYWDGEYHYNEQEIINHFNQKHNNGNTKPAHAQDYDYYTENNHLYMYYDHEWCNCIKINNYIYEIVCPVTAIVNYLVEQRKEVYQRN